jgi:hypothetical protein
MRTLAVTVLALLISPALALAGGHDGAHFFFGFGVGNCGGCGWDNGYRNYASYPYDPHYGYRAFNQPAYLSPPPAYYGYYPAMGTAVLPTPVIVAPAMPTVIYSQDPLSAPSYYTSGYTQTRYLYSR